MSVDVILDRQKVITLLYLYCPWWHCFDQSLWIDSSCLWWHWCHCGQTVPTYDGIDVIVDRQFTSLMKLMSLRMDSSCLWWHWCHYGQTAHTYDGHDVIVDRQHMYQCQWQHIDVTLDRQHIYMMSLRSLWIDSSCLWWHWCQSYAWTHGTCQSLWQHWWTDSNVNDDIETVDSRQWVHA